jgi:predicted component of type VI protein secretion system
MNRIQTVASIGLLLAPAAAAAQATPNFGAEEFGMTRRELVQAIERGEELIAKCMQEQVFRILVESMTAEHRAGLQKLQDYERRVATRSFQLTEKYLTPVEEQIQKELFARKVQ